MDAATLDTLADKVADRMARYRTPVLTLSESVRYVGKKSTSAFYRWCEEQKVKPCSQGRYSRKSLDMGLNKEARRGER